MAAGGRGTGVLATGSLLVIAAGIVSAGVRHDHGSSSQPVATCAVNQLDIARPVSTQGMGRHGYSLHVINISSMPCVLREEVLARRSSGGFVEIAPVVNRWTAEAKTGWNVTVSVRVSCARRSVDPDPPIAAIGLALEGGSDAVKLPHSLDPNCGYQEGIRRPDTP